MKCSNCGSEIGENAKFCGSCGSKIEIKKHGSFGRVVASVFKVVLCTLIMLLCQSCVMLNYETVQISQMIPQSAIENTVEDYEAFREQMTGLLVEASKSALSHISLIMLIGCLLTILVLCLAMRVRKKNPIDEFKFSFIGPGRIFGFLIFGIALNMFVSGTITLIPFSKEIMDGYSTTSSMIVSDENIFLRIASTAIVIPITEEMVFRGYGMTRLKSAMGRVPAVIVSAVLFGLCHFAFNESSLISVCYAFFIGLIFAYSFDKYDSVLPGIFCHIGFNLMSLVEFKNASLWLVLYAVSIPVMVFMAIKLFKNYPNFADILYTPNRFEGRNDKEKSIIMKMRELRGSDEAPDAEEVESLAKAWDEIHGKKKDGGVPHLKDDVKEEYIPDNELSDEENTNEDNKENEDDKQ